MLYQAIIRSRFPNQPLADSLPDIFPVGGPGPLPTFDYNWVVQPSGAVKTWLAAASLPAGAKLLFLKEGNFEQTTVLATNPAGGMHVSIWTGLTVVGELDQLEVRNAANITIARGERNSSLAEPT